MMRFLRQHILCSCITKGVMIIRKSKKQLKTAEQWLLANPAPPEKGAAAGIYVAGRTAYAVIREITSGRLALHATSLVYTTLLSIVPLLALSFSVLQTMGAHQRMEPFLFQFFEPMGPEGIEIAEQILVFVDQMKVGVLGSVGLAFLVYTVISLVQKIELSFNTIWRVPNLRSMGQRFSNYLSVILVGPLLMVSAIGITATVFSTTIMQRLMEIEPLGSVIIIMSRFTPFLLVVLAFTFLYTFMPNTRVRLRYALIGGLIAGLAWQAGSMAFATFVATSTRYAAIYSSFAIGIFLLIWIYLNWMILLAGASIVFYLQTPGSIALHRDVEPSPELQEKAAMTIMWQVCRPFARGEPPPGRKTLEEQLNIPWETARKISDKLIRAGLLMPAGENGDHLVPGKALDRITPKDVLDAARKDEDRIVARLPDVLPDNLAGEPRPGETATFSELMRPETS